MIDIQYNRLLVLEVDPIKKHKQKWYKCLCVCGNTVSVPGPKIRSGHTQSCGCLNRERKGQRITRWLRSPDGRKKNSDRLKSLRGPNAIHWKGGKEEENVRLRKSPEAKEWRQKVYERDGFLCTICKIPGKRLNAHHIKPWTHFPELRYDLDNGQTVCADCHKDLHKIHGNPKRKR